MHLEISIKVHNMTYQCNGIKTLVKDATFHLPDCDVSGYNVTEACRVIDQWLYATSYWRLMSQQDCDNCKSTGVLGTNISRLLTMGNGTHYSVFKSGEYKLGTSKSHFSITCKVIK